MGIREKQNFLTIIIIISIIAIIVILSYIIYPELVKKQVDENINNGTESTTEVKTENTTPVTESTQSTESTENTQSTQTTQTLPTENTENTTATVGQEEIDSQQDSTGNETKSKEERAIELAKQEWGETDTSVDYTIEQKDGNKYYISVKKGTIVQLWYEVDTENWTISQY